uniref:Uncharacterized protein n=1 Tax=candidate division WOR-3 bacterium TaxID=2052148 RepID=A0A7V3KNG2_UNCW3
MIRIKDGLPTAKSLKYVIHYIQGQFDTGEELMKRNLVLRDNIIEQSIMLVLAEVSPSTLQALELYSKGKK